MKLRSKKLMAARTLKVGKKRIHFSNSRLDEIKEAITKQDIRDLLRDKAIIIKEIKGRRKNPNKTKKKSTGNVIKKVKTRKKDYVILTRKLRNFLKDMKQQNRISQEEIIRLRKKIRNKNFRSKAQLKEHIGNLKK